MSIPIPIAMAAIVIVIISRGILAKPINPRIIKDGIMFGITAIRAIEIDLNTSKKSIKMIVKTVKIVLTCEENKLCKRLL